MPEGPVLGQEWADLLIREQGRVTLAQVLKLPAFQLLMCHDELGLAYPLKGLGGPCPPRPSTDHLLPLREGSTVVPW